jgi:hypothetical protein
MLSQVTMYDDASTPWNCVLVERLRDDIINKNLAHTAINLVRLTVDQRPDASDTEFDVDNNTLFPMHCKLYSFKTLFYATCITLLYE